MRIIIPYNWPWLLFVTLWKVPGAPGTKEKLVKSGGRSEGRCLAPSRIWFTPTFNW